MIVTVFSMNVCYQTASFLSTADIHSVDKIEVIHNSFNPADFQGGNLI